MSSSLYGSSGMQGISGMQGPAGLPARNNSAGQTQGNIIPKGYKSGQLQNFTPEQMQLFQQMFSNVSPQSYLSRLSQGDEGIFNEIEKPAMRQFQDLQGQLGSRFSELAPGAMSARGGSGFKNQANQATTDFASQLQSQRQQLQMQAIMELMGLGEHLLGQRPYEQFLVPQQKKPSFLQQLLGGLSGGAGQLLGGFGGAMGQNYSNNLFGGGRQQQSFGQQILGPAKAGIYGGY